MIERPRAGCLRAWVFHAMLVLALIRHVRVAMDFPRLWAALGINADSMSACVGGAAGIVIMLTVIFLLLRRMTQERVRQIIDEPRTILKASCADYREMTPSGSENWCRGGEGGLSAMDTIREFRMDVSGKKKSEQIKATGAKFVAAPCANCKRQLTQLMEHHEMDVEVGGVHDMVYRAIVLDYTGKMQ